MYYIYFPFTQWGRFLHLHDHGEEGCQRNGIPARYALIKHLLFSNYSTDEFFSFDLWFYTGSKTGTSYNQSLCQEEPFTQDTWVTQGSKSKFLFRSSLFQNHGTVMHFRELW